MTIPASSTRTIPVVPSFGFTHIAVAAKLSQNGNLVLNKSPDMLGAIRAGSATAGMTASVQTVLDHSSTTLLQGLSVSITNSAASVATLSGFMVVLSK